MNKELMLKQLELREKELDLELERIRIKKKIEIEREKIRKKESIIRHQDYSVFTSEWTLFKGMGWGHRMGI